MTYWRELPSMVVARDADATVIKSQLAQRFQDAIDEAAMRLGETDADAYLAGWTPGANGRRPRAAPPRCATAWSPTWRSIGPPSAWPVPRPARDGAVGVLVPG